MTVAAPMSRVRSFSLNILPGFFPPDTGRYLGDDFSLEDMLLALAMEKAAKTWNSIQTCRIFKGSVNGATFRRIIRLRSENDNSVAWEK